MAAAADVPEKPDDEATRNCEAINALPTIVENYYAKTLFHFSDFLAGRWALGPPYLCSTFPHCWDHGRLHYRTLAALGLVRDSIGANRNVSHCWLLYANRRGRPGCHRDVAAFRLPTIQHRSCALCAGRN